MIKFKINFMMKKVFSCLLIFCFAGIFTGVFAQESVKEAVELADKLSNKVKKGTFNDFKEVYVKAIAEIDKIIADAPNSEFGYDAIAANAPDWIELNNILATFPEGKIVFKEESIDLHVVDYKPVLADAKIKSCDAYFAAGKKILSSASDYDGQYESFKMFLKANEYGDHHKDEILNLRAEVYYNEAVRLSSSTDLTDLKKSVNLFYDSNKMVDGYKDNKAKREELSPKVAEAVYQQAVLESQTETLEAQQKAYDLFIESGQWVKDYKDSREKADMISAGMEIHVFVVDKNGTVFLPQKFEYELQSKTKKHVVTPGEISAFEGLDMNNPANYSAAVKKYGKGIVIIKADISAVKYDYQAGAPKVTTETKNYYTLKKRDEKEEEEIDEQTYKASKKIIDFGINNNADPGDRVFIYTGELTRTVESASVTADIPVEIWDLRNPEKPVKVFQIELYQKRTDSKTVETYDGDVRAQPKKLTVENKTIATKEELIAGIKTQEVNVAAFVKSHINEFAAELDKIEYRHPVK